MIHFNRAFDLRSNTTALQSNEQAPPAATKTVVIRIRFFRRDETSPMVDVNLKVYVINQVVTVSRYILS